MPMPNSTYSKFLIFFFLFSAGFAYGQTTIWRENFTYSNNTVSGQGNPAIAGWNSQRSGTNGVYVNSGVLRAQNVNNSGLSNQWLIDTDPIEIGGYTNISITMDITGNGPMENVDDIRVEYNVGAGWNTFATNGYLINNGWGSRAASQTGLSGTELRLRITFRNSEATEFYTVDNILVRGTIPNDPPEITAVGDQDFCPGQSSINIVESISITDSDDTTTQAVYIQISSGYQNGEDLLTLMNAATHSSNGITNSWDATEGKLTLSGPATYIDFITAIEDVVYSTSSATPTGTRDFSITVGEANYLPLTGHYYLYMDSLGITWSDANAAANASTYYGLQGYLATLTSQEEANYSGSQAQGVGWIGASDATTEGDWRWVTGPEAGTAFWSGAVGGTELTFAFWNANEPNDYGGNEDYAHITDPSVTSQPGSWNDLSNTGAASGAYQPQGYVVEYGGMSGDPVLNITATTTITIGNPTAPVSGGDQAYCLGSTIPTLTASVDAGETVDWYDAASGGTLLLSGNTSFTPAEAGNYFAETRNTSAGCLSTTRTEIILTSNICTVITNRKITTRVSPVPVN